MHYRCVFNMLKSCVRVGLDWAELMMFLLLHIICSCIFHAYVTSFFYILILICVGSFLCVCVSLSFFLCVNCSMAPKRKSTLSKNPLHSGASSSDSTPSYVRFCDEEACTNFSENFSRCGMPSRSIRLFRY